MVQRLNQSCPRASDGLETICYIITLRLDMPLKETPPARHRALRLSRRRQDDAAQSRPQQSRGAARRRHRQRHERGEHRRRPRPRGGAELSRTDEKLVEMTNGCICCTLRDDLLEEVRAARARGPLRLSADRDRTGIAEPLPVAATFDFRDEDGDSLSDVARLDTMVTVVDAANLLQRLLSPRFPARSRRDRRRGGRAHARRPAGRADRIRRRHRAEQGRTRRRARAHRTPRARSSAP